MRKKSQSKTTESVKHADLPLFCDFTCRHADFAPAETSGACRREMAVYCVLFKKFNNKHNRCLGPI